MSKTKWYWIGGVVALALIVLFFVSLYNSTKTPTSSVSSAPFKLVVWGTFEDTENMAPFISDFEQKYKGAQIEYTQKNAQDYETDLLNALAAGTGPDIFVIHNDWLPKYQDKLIEAPKEAFTVKSYKDTFVDVASDDFVSNGKVYAAPLSVDSLALYYNKDILGSAGIALPAKTWDDLKRDVKKITVRGDGSFIPKSGVALGASSNINRAVDILYLFMLQNKAVPYTSDYTQPTFDQAVTDNSGNTTFPAADSLAFYGSFSNPSSDVYSWNNKSNYSIDAFVNGELGYMYGYSYLKDTIKQKAPNLNYDVAPVPQPKSGQNLVNLANYYGFAVSKQTKSPNGAWAFISSMTSKKSLTDYYTRHPLPAARKDMISDQIDTDLGVFASANLTAKSFYKKDATKVDSIISDLIDDVTLRGKQIDQSLSNASQKIGQLRLSGEQ
ncbi:MAG: hypothetical protein JWO40_200 [Candidatus Doudnabacteria bacterium]|nr:hypothetical protein [Candidatus Doudnabacteria bacterium]